MANKRKIEVFSAGCPVCQTAIARIQAMACPSCDIIVLDMATPEAAARATELGVAAVPAVAVDGKLADCCAGRGPDDAALRAAGLGRPLS